MSECEREGEKERKKERGGERKKIVCRKSRSYFRATLGFVGLFLDRQVSFVGLFFEKRPVNQA